MLWSILALREKTKMKRLAFILLFVVSFFSCRKDGEPEEFDFSISQLERIDARVEENITLRIVITSNNNSPENVILSLDDVPEGITCHFSKESGIPEYSTDLELKISRQVKGGLYILKLSATSEKLKKTVPVIINVDAALSASFTVYHGISSGGNASSLADSALVKIFKNESSYLLDLADYKQYTNGGKAYFYRLPAGNYLFTIEKGPFSNIVQKRNVGGVMKGFIVCGIFRTQQEILNSAQPKAKPGDLKLRDLNGDNRIDEADLGQYDTFSIYEGQVNEKVIWIGQ
jgi:hypothetical protein